jgi:hypothetical protein
MQRRSVLQYMAAWPFALSLADRVISGQEVASESRRLPTETSGVLPPAGGLEQKLQKLRSNNLHPHFETLLGRQIFFVDGLPFFVLASEVCWDQSHYGRYRETMGYWDYLYPAARKLHMNTLKVPVKWSQVEPEKGVFDFSFVDHVKELAESNGLKLIFGWFGHYGSGASGNIYSNLDNYLFAPMYIVEDEKTYPRAVDAHGRSYHGCISYAYDAVVEEETAAFRAFMRHIGDTDSKTHTVLMIQVENEIAVFNGAARRNSSTLRDHSPRANELFKAGGYTDDRKFSDELLASHWLRPLTEAGAQEYELPFYLNDGLAYENIATYLKLCPRIAFVANDLYSRSASEDDLRWQVESHRTEGNIVAIAETNSDRSAVAPRLAFLAIGDYVAPLFSPWAINISWIIRGEPYILSDGTLANGAADLIRTYTCIGNAASPLALCAGTDKLRVFLEGGATEAEVAGAQVSVVYDPGGQIMILHPEPGEFVVIGWKVSVKLDTPLAKWPALKKLQVESGHWDGPRWVPSPAPVYYAVENEQTVRIRLFEDPVVIRVYAK